MSLLTARETFARFNALSAALLPDAHYVKMVSSNEQQREIDLLRETLHLERFFFVINVHRPQLEQVHGVERWLGYPDKSFTLLNYFSIIHPAHAEAHHLAAVAMLEALMQGVWKIEFMKQRYSNVIALQHRNGHYLCFKRLSCIFQYNERHQLLEYVNEFTLIGPYNGQNYGINALNEDGTRLEWMDDLAKRMRSHFENRNFFSFQELRILRKYAYLPHLSSKEIAQAFKIEPSTLATHKKRIQKKAEEYFQKHFENIRQIATVLKEQGMI